ncbi:hypothetical protein MKK55_28890 [Methylobacterium sp. J-059]|uniref:hypothetical protein n=1 Tax=Methylobacterium sp. J-059 TaxID=2836643 RepID=UPI001FBB2D5D|nr:hypothetical protein [Methylobacterium sp. J-059]MCJ2042934.1 hypothetical protein [Methylobacterium sp. J-059]
MAPNDRPANENGKPVAPRSMADRVEFVVSIVLIAAWCIAAWLYLKPEGWTAIAIGITIAFVSSVAAALYRLVVHGRA